MKPCIARTIFLLVIVILAAAVIHRLTTRTITARKTVMPAGIRVQKALNWIRY